MKIQEAKDLQAAVDAAALELNRKIREATKKGLTVQIEHGVSDHVGLQGPVEYVVIKCWVKPTLLEV